MVMFAGYHSFIPSVIGKWRGIETWIVIGGTDASSYPSIHYGNFRKHLYGWFTARSIERAFGILPVHASLLRSENSFFVPSSIQGVDVFVPQRSNRTVVIENGFDPNVWTRSSAPRNLDFITVAEGLHSESRRILKGVDLFLQVAAKFPNRTFTLVGSGASSLAGKVSANVVLHESMTPEALREAFNRHRYIVQWSVSEGFPNALCEAMLCGCVPLVSKVTSMPEIIGDTGFVLEKYDVEMASRLIEHVPAIGMEGASAARLRIVKLYTLERRAVALQQIIEGQAESLFSA